MNVAPSTLLSLVDAAVAALVIVAWARPMTTLKDGGMGGGGGGGGFGGERRLRHHTLGVVGLAARQNTDSRAGGCTKRRASTIPATHTDMMHNSIASRAHARAAARRAVSLVGTWHAASPVAVRRGRRATGCDLSTVRAVAGWVRRATRCSRGEGRGAPAEVETASCARATNHDRACGVVRASRVVKYKETAVTYSGTTPSGNRVQGVGCGGSATARGVTAPPPSLHLPEEAAPASPKREASATILTTCTMAWRTSRGASRASCGA